VAFWLWVGLYLATPFLVWGVWVANRRRGTCATVDHLLLPLWPVWSWAAGALAVAAGVYLFVLPSQAIDVWPWMLTPLTHGCSVPFMLGVAGLGVITDARWSASRIMLQVQVLMLALILLAVARTQDQFDGSRPLTWLLLGGFVVALASAAILSVSMDARAARRT
jgi:hypothetical protein